MALISVGAALPLELVLHDGATTKFPSAFVTDQVGVAVAGSPFTLIHTANGLYRNTAFTALVANQKLRAVYVTYNEIGRTTESVFHTRATEDWDVETRVEVVNTKLGTPTGATVSADLASVQTKLGTPAGATLAIDIASVQTRLGAPSGASVSADVAAVQIKLGSPVGASVSADIAAVKADEVILLGRLTALRATAIDNLDATVSSRATAVALTAVAAQVTGVQSDTDDIQLKIGTPAGTSLASDVAAVKADTASTLAATGVTNARLTGPRAANLDFLDVSVASRATDVSAATAVWNAARSASISTGSFGEANQGVLSVARASNLDRLDVVLSTRESSTAASTRETNILTRLGSPSGATVSADIASARTEIGAVKTDTASLNTKLTTLRAANLDNLDAAVSSRAAPAQIAPNVWGINRSAFIAAGTFGEGNQGVLTSQRATNLDNLDATVSTRATGVEAAAILAAVVGVQADTDDIQTKIGLPVGSSLASDVASVKAEAVALNAKLSSQRAANLDYLDVTLSTRATGSALTAVAVQVTGVQADTDDIQLKIGTPAGVSIASDLVSVKSDSSTLVARLTSGRATAIDNLDVLLSTRATASSIAAVAGQITSVQADTDDIQAKVGIPIGTTIAADIASVKSDTSSLQAKLTTQRATNLDRLDVIVSTRSTGAQVIAVGSQVTAVQADTDDIQLKLGIPSGDSLSTDILNVKTDTGLLVARLTAQRATNLDNLDASVSSRTTPAQISPQVWGQVRTGQNVTGTFGEALQGVLSTVRAVNLDKLDVVLSTREAALDASARETAILSRIGTPAGASVSADLASVKADTSSLQTKITSQRATNLDNLDAAISTRSTGAALALVQADTDDLQAKLGISSGISIAADLTTLKTTTVNIYTDTHTAGVMVLPSEKTSIVDLTWDELAAEHVGPGTTGAQINLIDDIEADTSSLNDVKLTTARAINLDRLDVNLSTRASGVQATDIQSGVTNTLSRIGIPTATVSADIASIKSELGTVNTKIGSPVTTLSTDVAAVRSVVDATSTKIGTPIATVSTDIASVHSRIGSPTNATISADLAAIKAQENIIETKIDDLSSASDSAISTPPTFILPSTGTSLYRIYWRHFTNGIPTDPYSGPFIVLTKSNGVNIVSSVMMTKENDGVFYYDYTVSSTSENGIQVVVKINYKNEALGPNFQSIATTTQSASASTVEDILAIIGNPANGTISGDMLTNKNLIDTLIARLGVPESTIVSALMVIDSREQLIKAQTDKMSFTGANINSQTKVNEDKSSYALSLADKDTLVNLVFDEPISGHMTLGTAGEAIFSGTLGFVNSTVIGNISGSVWDKPRTTHVAVGSFGQSLQGVITAQRAQNLDNLDAVLSTRSSGSQVATLSSDLQVARSEAGNYNSLNISSFTGLSTSITNFSSDVASKHAENLLNFQQIDTALDHIHTEVDTGHLAEVALIATLQTSVNGLGSWAASYDAANTIRFTTLDTAQAAAQASLNSITASEALHFGLIETASAALDTKVTTNHTTELARFSDVDAAIAAFRSGSVISHAQTQSVVTGVGTQVSSLKTELEGFQTTNLGRFTAIDASVSNLTAIELIHYDNEVVKFAGVSGAIAASRAEHQSFNTTAVSSLSNLQISLNNFSTAEATHYGDSVSRFQNIDSNLAAFRTDENTHFAAEVAATAAVSASISSLTSIELSHFNAQASSLANISLDLDTLQGVELDHFNQQLIFQGFVNVTLQGFSTNSASRHSEMLGRFTAVDGTLSTFRTDELSHYAQTTTRITTLQTNTTDLIAIYAFRNAENKADLQTIKTGVSVTNTTLGEPATSIAGEINAIRLKTNILAFDGSLLKTQVIQNTDKFGYVLSPGSEDSMSNRLWNEPLAGHTIVGTTGHTLLNIDATTAEAVTDAVWNEPQNLHTGSGTMGYFMDVIRQASQNLVGTLSGVNGIASIRQDISSLALAQETRFGVTDGKILSLEPVISTAKNALKAEIDENQILIEQVRTTVTGVRADILNAQTATNAKIETVRTDVGALQNNTTARFVVPDRLVKPETGTKTYEFHLRLYDDTGHPEAPDSAPTIRLRRIDTGVDIVTNVPMLQDGSKVGAYRYEHTISAGTSNYPILVEAAVVENGVTRYIPAVTEISSFDSGLGQLQGTVNALTAQLTGVQENITSGVYGLSAIKTTQTNILNEVNHNESIILSVKAKTDLITTTIAQKSDVNMVTDALSLKPDILAIAARLDMLRDQLRGAGSQTLADIYNHFNIDDVVKTNDPRLINLDEKISTRSTLTAAQVWTHGTREPTAITIPQGDINRIWSFLSTQANVSGSIGNRLVTMLDAAVSSRARAIEVTQALNGVAQEASLSAIRAAVETEANQNEAKLVDLMTQLGLVKAKTDLVPQGIATQVTLETRLTAVDLALSQVALSATGIKARTDLIPTDIARETTVAQIPVDTLRTGDARLSRLDVNVSSRGTTVPSDLTTLAKTSEMNARFSIIDSKETAVQAALANLQLALDSLPAGNGTLPTGIALSSEVTSARNAITSAISALQIPPAAPTSAQIWAHGNRSLTQGISVDTSQLATKADLLALAPHQYGCKISSSFTDQGVINMLVWGVRDGLRQTTAEDCTVEIREADGSLAYTDTQSAANIHGIFSFSQALVLEANSSYYVVISIKMDGAVRTAHEAFATIG